MMQAHPPADKKQDRKKYLLTRAVRGNHTSLVLTNLKSQ
jgi:aspartate oxidase